MTEVIHVLGGGTVNHVRPHLAISSPAYGDTARSIAALCEKACPDRKVELHLTRMANAGKGDLETNADVEKLVDRLIADPTTKVIVMSVALADWEGFIQEESPTKSGKDQPRLHTADGEATMHLVPAKKLIGKIRKQRKDIFLIGFKVTAGATEDEQYLAGLHSLKTNSCNLVLANDVHTKLNMIVAPELARYAVTKDREHVLAELVAMMSTRSRLSFTRTTVLGGDLVQWDSPEVPSVLRGVVDWCADHGAYKPFNDVTVGHFAFKNGDSSLVSSRRKRNYTRRSDRDLVRVVFSGNEMFAFGAKPSAGTPSQFAVLNHYPEFDCIVHFHCPAKPGSPVMVRSQRELECGSHECGENTWKGISKFGNLAAVMLDKHGPNIIFSSSRTTQEEVTKFIEENFDLSVRSDGMRE